MAYHIREGAYGDVRLEGLSVLAVLRFDGNFWAGEAQVTYGIFIDARADARQRGAIQQSSPVRRAASWPVWRL